MGKLAVQREIGRINFNFSIELLLYLSLELLVQKYCIIIITSLL